MAASEAAAAHLDFIGICIGSGGGISGGTGDIIGGGLNGGGGGGGSGCG